MKQTWLAFEDSCFPLFCEFCPGVCFGRMMGIRVVCITLYPTRRLEMFILSALTGRHGMGLTNGEVSFADLLQGRPIVWQGRLSSCVYNSLCSGRCWRNYQAESLGAISAQAVVGHRRCGFAYLELMVSHSQLKAGLLCL